MKSKSYTHLEMLIKMGLSDSREELYDQIVMTALSVSNASIVTFNAYSSDDNSFGDYWAGTVLHLDKAASFITELHPFFEKALEQSEILLESNIGELEALAKLQFTQAEQIMSIIIIPLVFIHNPFERIRLGVVSIGYREPKEFDKMPDLVDLLVLFQIQASNLIHHANLYRDIRPVRSHSDVPISRVVQLKVEGQQSLCEVDELVTMLNSVFSHVLRLQFPKLDDEIEANDERVFLTWASINRGSIEVELVSTNILNFLLGAGAEGLVELTLATFAGYFLRRFKDIKLFRIREDGAKAEISPKEVDERVDIEAIVNDDESKQQLDKSVFKDSFFNFSLRVKTEHIEFELARRVETAIDSSSSTS